MISVFILITPTTGIIKQLFIIQNKTVIYNTLKYYL